MDTTVQKLTMSHRATLPDGQRTTDNGRRTAFTLVELLVVITIIGILASLIVVAAVGALRKGQETRIKAELNQMADAVEHSKNERTAYPPNCQTDGTSGPIDETLVLNDLKRYLKQVAPRHREPDDLLKCLVGMAPSNTSKFPNALPGGMTAGEALVFWLGGFSSDEKYPISGEGGPSYRITATNNNENRTLDPISNRKWVFPFEVTRLAPKADDKYFDDTNNRFIEYRITIPGQNNGAEQIRRINFWQYVPAKSKEPYLYFDTSRHPAYDASVTGNAVARFDPPAATTPSGIEAHVHALKRRSDTTNPNMPQIEFVNPDKYQILHCGVDDAWGLESFERMSVHDLQNNWNDYLLYPDGPFTGDIADTVVNFATQTRLEDVTP